MSALDLLKLDPCRIPSVAEKIWAPAVLGFLGFGAVCYMNWGTRRPIFSGIQKHVLVATVMASIGKLADNHRNNYLAERDAVLRHYIELHPDDFATPNRKKYAEIFDTWIPVR